MKMPKVSLLERQKRYGTERACEKAGYIAVEAVDTISNETVREFFKSHLKTGQTVRTDAFPALNSVKKMHDHQKKVVPAEEASEWLPLVHVIIGNLKKFLNGTFHGVSLKYLQEYLNEFSYRFIC